ncbi:TPA: hypothetical protein ACOM9Z_001337 [Staphylococcus aureus]
MLNVLPKPLLLIELTVLLSLSLARSVNDLPPTILMSVEIPTIVPIAAPIAAPKGPPIPAPIAVPVAAEPPIAPKSTIDPTIFFCPDFSFTTLFATAATAPSGPKSLPAYLSYFSKIFLVCFCLENP